MRARRNLTRQSLVEAAERLVDEHGLGALTMAALAKSVGVPASSLYTSVDGIDGLVRELAIRGLHGLAEEITHSALGYSGADAVARLMEAYRRYAKAHRGLYAAAIRRPRLEDADEVSHAARVTRLIHAAIAAYDFEGAERVHATRIIFSVLHGFVSSEMADVFGVEHAELSVDESFDRLVGVLTSGLAATAVPPEGAVASQSVP